MKFSATLFAGLASAAAITPRGSPPTSLTIVSVQTSGNGCPQGTVSTTISPDRQVLTVGFDSFYTYIGPGTTVQDRTKNCQLHLNLKYPAGFTYAVIQSTYHGYAMLESGVTATFLSTYFFSSDAAKTTTTRTTLSGGGEWAAGNVYTRVDAVPNASIIYAPCGTTSILNLNNRVALTSSRSSASGEVSTDDHTVDLSQQIHFNWLTC
jgi:hypothetical protein